MMIKCLECNNQLQPSILNGVLECSTCKLSWEVQPISSVSAQSIPIPRSVVSSSCFNHPQNEGDSECATCGKLICRVCSFKLRGKTQCGQCYTSPQAGDENLKRNRAVRYDWMANYATLLTLFTGGLAAPMSIYFIYKHFTAPELLYGGKTGAGIQSIILLVFAVAISGGAGLLLLLGELNDH